MPIPSDWGNNVFDSRLIEAIKIAEGLRLKAYKDTLGYWTCGFGHLLPDQDKDWSEFVCTNEQAGAWLMEDLKTAREGILSIGGLTGIDGVRLSALIELCFNLGLKKLKLFHRMWAAIENRDWIASAAELLDSAWAKQVGEARSSRLAFMLKEGQYPS